MKLNTRFLAVLVLFVSFHANAQLRNPSSFKTLHSFPGGSNAYPRAGLINVGGTLFGTTVGVLAQSGLSGPSGTVFEFDPATHVETVLYRFSGGSDGEGPEAGLLNVGGTLYGTTNLGGGMGCGGLGCGTVFEFNPATQVGTVLYRFSGGSDGANPEASLILVGGTLYGTTAAGGGTGCFMGLGCGTAFAINPATGDETLLHTFDGSDGSNPLAALVNVEGVLYGTTYRGGAETSCVGGYGCGTAFKINKKTGKLTVLHSFSADGSDGASPEAPLININGTLYGTTNLDGTGGCPQPYGCGTVFAMNRTTGVVTALHEFTGGSDGQHPTAAVLNVGGTLYGTTQGGTTPNTGAVYSVNPTTGDETVLYEFSGGTDGGAAQSPLIQFGGVLISTTYEGGVNGYGTVYKLRP